VEDGNALIHVKDYYMILESSILSCIGKFYLKLYHVSVGIQEIAWAFGGMIFALVYCTAGISGHSLFFTSLFFYVSMT
jgi:hypothetical protein